MDLDTKFVYISKFSDGMHRNKYAMASAARFIANKIPDVYKLLSKNKSGFWSNLKKDYLSKNTWNPFKKDFWSIRNSQTNPFTVSGFLNDAFVGMGLYDAYNNMQQGNTSKALFSAITAPLFLSKAGLGKTLITDEIQNYIPAKSKNIKTHMPFIYDKDPLGLNSVDPYFNINSTSNKEYRNYVDSTWNNIWNNK